MYEHRKVAVVNGRPFFINLKYLIRISPMDNGDYRFVCLNGADYTSYVDINEKYFTEDFKFWLKQGSNWRA